MDPTWDHWLERGRSLAAAPPLSRAEKSRCGRTDPKWALGDLLLDIPEHRLGSFSAALGKKESELRRLREVASRWPSTHRVDASWSAHRDLKDHDQRFDLIHAGMTVREAAEAAGKQPIDAKPLQRMSQAEKVNFAVTLLMDKKLNDDVVAELKSRRVARRAERAARMAADERSAEYKEAMRALRVAQATKSPEVAFLEVVFKLQEAAEYVRAVVAAATDTEATIPLIPPHREPELLMAIDALVDVGHEALDALAPVAASPNLAHAHQDVIDVDVARPRPELLERP